MRQSRLLNRTLRDVPSDAEAASHRLLLRAGLIRQTAAGVYSFLPLGLRVLKRIEAIVREEMERAGAQELLMPALQPAELWRESGRWDVYGPELMRLQDRHGREFALGATHEEVVTTLLRGEITSYKRLPVTVFQIQTKFRDERRPRFGLLRGREFMMKDAYSFDVSEEGTKASYQSMFEAYHRIFSRCGLTFRPVEADSGAIGGTDTHEFMALAEVGEDTILHCPSCGYAANVERAEGTPASPASGAARDPAAAPVPLPSPVHTPDTRTIAELVATLGTDPSRILKAVAFEADGRPVVALIRGDSELNETKVMRLLQAQTTGLLTEQRIREELQSVPGFIGPVGLKGCSIVADNGVKELQEAVAGANLKDTHLLHVVPDRDFTVDAYADLRAATEGDGCPRCGTPLEAAKGIEVGHVFRLGTKYSELMGAAFTDEAGHSKPMVMGCYGIGISRTLAAVIEQHYDEQGIRWPFELAPFKLHLITVQSNDQKQIELSQQLYDQFAKQSLDVLWDDREERPGAKFADADLLGIPYQIRIGRKAAEGLAEIKCRRTGTVMEIAVDALADHIGQLLQNEQRNGGNDHE